MAKSAKKTATFDSFIILQILVAVFLFTLGLIGITKWNSNLSQFGRSLNQLFGRANDPFNLIVAIVELAAGVVVFAALFVAIKGKVVYWLTLVIAIVWAVLIVISFFSQQVFEPDFIIWLNRLVADLIILVALWLINRKYA